MPGDRQGRIDRAAVEVDELEAATVAAPARRAPIDRRPPAQDHPRATPLMRIGGGRSATDAPRREGSLRKRASRAASYAARLARYRFDRNAGSQRPWFGAGSSSTLRPLFFQATTWRVVSPTLSHDERAT